MGTSGLVPERWRTTVSDCMYSRTGINKSRRGKPGRCDHMIEPAETLRAEHETIQGLLSVLDVMAARLRSDAPVPREDFGDVMTVIVELADRCHHAKEEDVLFPALAGASPQMGSEIARRLTSDHQAFRKLVASMRDLIPRVALFKSVRAQLAKLLRRSDEVRSTRAYDAALHDHRGRTVHRDRREQLDGALRADRHAAGGRGGRHGKYVIFGYRPSGGPPLSAASGVPRPQGRRGARWGIATVKSSTARTSPNAFVSP